ncbi:DUF4252 domain-containing protein [Chitinophaga rhizophila]|uniref:DUF4252 domain-containing protein n=1 Tax=Chitinophaga rhizophila TaxID=2866212 RepID=A0ABS7GIW3_9BACT|nr:DUF4252 domain-containing protein [Chitinophaga rhizophila]MBW8687640.1 DUF4252 domain-containing protein [Chitinophaga rhizophila]
MKFLPILVASLLLAISPAIAQKKSLRKFYREYRGEMDGIRIGVGIVPLKLASWIIPRSVMEEEGVPLKKILGKVRKIKVYALEADGVSPIDKAAIQRLKQTLIDKDGFEPLVEVREQTANVYLLNKGADDELGNVVILVQDEGEFVMVNLRTTLHINDVNMLIKGFAKN